MRKVWISALSVVALIVAEQAVADQPTKPQDGFGVFLVMLDESPRKPDEKHPKDPDLEKAGGVEHYRRNGMIVVTLPLTAVDEIATHEGVGYVQRVWMGESLESWKGHKKKKGLRASPEAEPVAASWDSDTYAYDGTGNIQAIGGDTFGYDSAGRIIESEVGNLSETYAYDSFGNLKAKSTAGRPSPIPEVDSTTNRFAHELYDVAGNVRTARASGTSMEQGAEYEYDSLGMVTRVGVRTSGGGGPADDLHGRRRTDRDALGRTER